MGRAVMLVSLRSRSQGDEHDGSPILQDPVCQPRAGNLHYVSSSVLTTRPRRAAQPHRRMLMLRLSAGPTTRAMNTATALRRVTLISSIFTGQAVLPLADIPTWCAEFGSLA